MDGLADDSARVSESDGYDPSGFGPDDTQAVSAPPKAPERDLEQGTTIDRYMVVEKIGAGGMGVVYAAYDPMLNRKVAIKLLRVELDCDGSQMRLLREAQVMAQLSHPNVLPIYDVGTWRDRVFLAAEFVDGQTLKDWMKADHGWRDVLRVFIDAGKGLTAAHVQGLIHRDFKPGNVLLDSHQRVRVMDFGLARQVGAAEEFSGPAGNTDEVTAEQTPALLTSELTRMGTAIGTPAYMAPEQREGGEVDPRADQFSFCVALYEALYGRRPFPGRGQQLARAVEEGRILAPPPSSVPAAVRRAVLRGLARDPERRWSSMEALLAILERSAVRRRITTMTAAVALAATAAGGLAYGKYSGANAALCSGATEQVAAVWGESQRSAIQASFVATKVPFAGAAWARVEPLLDRYASAWATAHGQSCEATQVRHEQSEALMDRQMACLDRRLWELDALVGALSRADARVVQNAARAASSLGSVQHCLDPELLQTDVDPPPDAIAGKVEDVRRGVAQLLALELTGQYPKAVDVGREVLAQAEPLGYAPVLAEVSFRLGVALGLSGHVDEAETLLKRATWLAEAERLDEVMARARISLVALYGLNGRSVDEVNLWASHARAGIGRMRGDLVLNMDLSNSIAISWMTLGKYDDALTQLKKSLELIDAIQEKYPPDSPEYLEAARLRGATHNNLGGTYHYLGQYPEARKHYAKAADLLAGSYGDYHPYWAMTMGNLGMMLQTLGEDEASVEALEQSKGVFERSVGTSHPHYAATLVKLAEVELNRAAPDKAHDLFQQAIDIYDAAYGGAHPLTFQAIEGLARVLYVQGQKEKARKTFRRSMEMAEEVAGEEHTGVASGLLGLARLDADAGNLERARSRFEKVIGILEETLAEDHRSLCEPLVLLANVMRDQGQLGVAEAKLERALRIRTAHPGRPEDLAEIQFTMAQVAARNGQDDRARELAKKAREGFEAAGKAGAEGLAAIEAWQTRAR